MKRAPADTGALSLVRACRDPQEVNLRAAEAEAQQEDCPHRQEPELEPEEAVLLREQDQEPELEPEPELELEPDDPLRQAAEAAEAASPRLLEDCPLQQACPLLLRHLLLR